jgi:Bacterial Ig-like domain
MSRGRVLALGVVMAGLVVPQATGQASSPTVSIDEKPPVRTKSQAARFMFSSAEPSVQFQCSLDAAAYEPCESPKEYDDLPEGTRTFAVRLRQQDAPPGTSSSTTYSWTIALTAPQIVLVEPASGITTVDATPTFAGTRGTAVDDSPAVIVEIWGETAVGDPLLTLPATIGEDGSWSATPTTPLDEEATYVARATQSDNVGNVGTAETTFVVDVPSVTLAAAPDGLITKGLDPLSITGTADGGAVSVDIYRDGTEDPPVAAAMTTLAADGEWSVTLVPPTGDGRYTIVARHFSGGTVADASAEAPLMVNALPPAPVAGFDSRASHRRVALWWKRPGDWDYDHVVIWRKPVGGTWRVVATAQTARSFVDVSVTNDRIYRYRIASVDAAGNRSAAVDLVARPSAFYKPAYLERVRAPVRLRWTAVPSATYYNVQVWRNGRKILSRWPERAGYDLRSSWRFGGRLHRLRAGTYTVYAWPGYGSKRAARYGDLRGWTRFVVR